VGDEADAEHGEPDRHQLQLGDEQIHRLRRDRIAQEDEDRCHELRNLGRRADRNVYHGVHLVSAATTTSK
jgi:hypothetical protein